MSGASVAEAQGQGAADEMAAEQASNVFSPLALGAALGLLAAVVSSRPALAADLENGEGVFTGNCVACHTGGNNSIVAEKKIRRRRWSHMASTALRRSSRRSPRAMATCLLSVRSLALTTLRMSPTTFITRRTSGEQRPCIFYRNS